MHTQTSSDHPGTVVRELSSSWVVEGQMCMGHGRRDDWVQIHLLQSQSQSQVGSSQLLVPFCLHDVLWATSPHGTPLGTSTPQSFSDITYDVMGVSGYESSVLRVASINVSWEVN